MKLKASIAIVTHHKINLEVIMKSIFLIFSILVLSFFVIACNEEPTNNPTAPGVLEKSPSFTAEYEVTLENLSPAGSQPLSPPILAVHSPSFRIFHIGGYASDELAQVAQDAVNGPLVSLLLTNPSEVSEVVVGAEGPIFPGSSQTFDISAQGNFTKLSLVTMLVNTNDGFTGTDKLQLPQRGSKTYYLRSYDAGSEENTELIAHIPGQGNPLMGNSTNDKIKYHPGILGVGDLDPAMFGWDEPVAKLTITRIN
jgi:hypothetical protein